MYRINQLCRPDGPILGRLSVIPIILSLFLLLIGCGLIRSDQAFDNEQEVVSAILADDWTKVAELTETVTAETPSVELRQIRGHALLALDKNNESSCLILSVVRGDDASASENLKMWKTWTQKLADKYPDRPAAHYLKGDALSRLEQWEEAILAFNRALELNQNHALSLNARGLVYAFRQEWDPALMDLSKAISLNQARAGAYANLGAYWMMKQVGAKGAEAAFDKALEISPEFVFALYGRACVKSVLGKDQEAKDDLKNAGDKATCMMDFLVSIIGSALTHIVEKEAPIVGVNSENPSMQLNTSFGNLMNSTSKKDFVKHYEVIVNIVKENPNSSLAQLTRNRLEKLSNDSSFAENLRYARDKVQRETRMKENFSTFASGFSAEVGLGVGSKIGRAQLKGDLKLSYSAEGPARRTLDDVRRTRRALERISPPGYDAKGFKTGLEEAIWDQGDWPFEAMNGLFYKLPSLATLPNKENGVEQ